MVPWLKLGVMSATIAPKPIWRGLVPPSLAVGAEPRLRVCKNWVAKLAWEALKPTVFELARLLPTTSIVVSAAVNPVSAVLSAEAKPMIYLLLLQLAFSFSNDCDSDCKRQKCGTACRGRCRPA